jgi:hypothetical protein
MPPPPGTMIYTILDRTLHFFQEPSNRERIQTQCIDPLLRHVLDRLFPYILLTCLLFSLILLMSLASVTLLVLHMRSMTGIATAATTSVATATTSVAALSLPSIIPAPV